MGDYSGNIEQLEEAMELLEGSIDLIRRGVRGIPGVQARAEAYIIPHLKSWVSEHHASLEKLIDEIHAYDSYEDEDDLEGEDYGTIKESKLREGGPKYEHDDYQYADLMDMHIRSRGISVEEAARYVASKGASEEWIQYLIDMYNDEEGRQASHEYYYPKDTCQLCNGDGYETDPDDRSRSKCPHCGGSGKEPKKITESIEDEDLYSLSSQELEDKLVEYAFRIGEARGLSTDLIDAAINQAVEEFYPLDADVYPGVEATVDYLLNINLDGVEPEDLGTF